MNENIEQGRAAARTYYSSQAFTGYTDYIMPEDAMRLMFASEDEPDGVARNEWVTGFELEQTEILLEASDANKR